MYNIKKGTKSAAFKTADFRAWRSDFYGRLQKQANAAGCPPQIFAFTGLRHWRELFPASKTRKFDYGNQEDIRPPGWPFPPSICKVFLLTSSSGAAALTNEARERPYRELAAVFKEIGGRGTTEIQYLEGCDKESPAPVAISQTRLHAG
jgi:hypothetical protein